MGYFTSDKRMLNRLFIALKLRLSNRIADRDNYRFSYLTEQVLNTDT